MRVASKLTGMHPQTLRKYERAGLLEPCRCKKLRLYSDEEILRLKLIKHLVEEMGLNLAGLRVTLRFQDAVLKIKNHFNETDLSKYGQEQWLCLFDESIKILGAVVDYTENNFMKAKKKVKAGKQGRCRSVEF